jgi:hypothetical protein
VITLSSGLQLVAVARPRGRWAIENIHRRNTRSHSPIADFAFDQASAWADPFLWAPLQIAANIGC